ncbi:unnamed protein product [Cylindrotheca closterium]|uniref:Uncharacterized protein n=1 Tax=Cylindrotheca closterium TaxID=2856 RepID=A0AAD2FCH5_9STRA|nr:unnamed protein product [Cylindrotheca closterium]
MDFNPLFRNRIGHKKYCAQCHKAEAYQEFVTCNCAVFHYCSTTCKDFYGIEHRRDCRLLARFRGKGRNVQFANLMMKNEYLCNKTKSRSKTTEMRSHTYEQVLDLYLYRFEEIKAMGTTTDVGVQAQQDFVLIKMRIPLLLAALGYDDLAITEVAVMMDFQGETPGRIPRTKFDDVIQDIYEERGEVYEAWPTCFILPIVLVKLRHVLAWRAYTTFISRTNRFPEDVRLCIGEFLIGHDIRSSTASLYVEQKQQLRQAISLIKQQDDNFASILQDHQYNEDDEEHDHAEDLLSYIYENDDYGFNDYGLFQFFRGCFRDTEAMKALAAEFINEEELEAGEEMTWERRPSVLRTKKEESKDFIQNEDLEDGVEISWERRPSVRRVKKEQRKDFVQKEELENGVEISWKRIQSICLKTLSTDFESEDELEDDWEPLQANWLSVKNL